MAAKTEVDSEASEGAVAEAGPPPGEWTSRAASSFGRVRSRRRIQLAQELVLEIQALRPTLHEALEHYQARMTGQITEVLRHLQGDDEGRPPRVPPVKTAAAMLHAIRAAEMKPRKGRAKDLVRLQELVAHLTELLPPRG